MSDSIRTYIGCMLGGLLLSASFGAEPVPPADQTSVHALLAQAAAVEATGELRAANEYYVKATAAHPDSAEVWAAYGEHLRFYVHDTKAAGAAFQKALSARPQDAFASAFALRGLGELAAKESRDREAEDFFTKSIETQPLADTHRSLCHLYCRQRRFKEAAEQAHKAVTLSPNDAIARLLYAAQLHRAGDQAEGRTQFKQALTDGGLDAHGEAAGPVHCCVFYNAAGYLAVLGDQPGALKMLKSFFETPNHRHLTREEIETDADFEHLKECKAFQTMLEAYFPDPAQTK